MDDLADKLLIAAVGGIIGLSGGALVTEIVRRWFFTPKLKMSFESGEFGIINEKQIEPYGAVVDGKEMFRDAGEAQFIRVSVQNVRFGVAVNCRAYLTNVERLNQHGEFECIFWDCLPLEWSWVGGQTFSLAKGVHGIVVVLRAGQESNAIMPFTPAPIPARYAELFAKPGIYRLAIVVGADNSNTDSICLQITWNGEWDGTKVEVVSCTKTRH